jgi:hypothetical protein
MATVFAFANPGLDAGQAGAFRSIADSWNGWRERRPARLVEISRPFVTDEINALIRHATENGLDPGAEITAPLYQAVVRYEALDAARRAGEEGAAAAAEILRLYTQLSALPALNGISGRTLLYAGSVVHHIRGLLAWGVLFVILAAGTEILLLQPEALGVTATPLLRYLNPFFWGGVGACVFLVKAIADKAAELTFDRLRMQGLGSRIFLGAVLGALLVNSLGLDVGQGSFTAAGLAFLGGLGVKAIYAAFEALVDGFHDRIAPRGQPAPGR